MKNPHLQRSWFDSKQGLGIGVTAYDRKDVESIVRGNRLAMQFEPSFKNCVENVDVCDLDQDHVVPSMGVVVHRGIWYPNL